MITSLEPLATEIINDPVMEQDIRNALIQKKVGKSRIIYKSSLDGFSRDEFHKLCDNQGPTLTVAQAENGRIFGAYTDITWTDPS